MDQATFNTLCPGDYVRVINHHNYPNLVGMDLEVTGTSGTQTVNTRTLSAAQVAQTGYIGLGTGTGRFTLGFIRDRVELVRYANGHALTSSLKGVAAALVQAPALPPPMTKEQYKALQAGDEVLGLVYPFINRKGVVERGMNDDDSGFSGSYRYVRVVYEGSISPTLQDAYEMALVKKNKNAKYPHTCNRLGCGAPAYVGAYDVDCSKCGKH